MELIPGAIGYDLRAGQDLADEVKLRQHAAGCDVVVHLAAIPGPEPRGFNQYFEANIVNTFRVAEACVHTGVRRLVYASSTSYYGYESDIPRPMPIGDPMTEKNVIQLLLPGPKPAKNKFGVAYGCSKVGGETVVSYYGLVGLLDVLILRFAPVDFIWDIGITRAHVAQAVKAAVDYEKKPRLAVFNVSEKGPIDTLAAERELGFQRID